MRTNRLIQFSRFEAVRSVLILNLVESGQACTTCLPLPDRAIEPRVES
jgi:hypothetical protein